MIFKRHWLVAVMALLFLLPSTFVRAESLMPLEDVRTGMRGIGKTVVVGSKIENFGVEVLGVSKNAGPSGDLILVRVYGDAVDKTGIAKGMSGSPVYIDNKLVGAIAYSWGATDQKVGMVTPIADMIKILDIPATPPLAAKIQEKESLPKETETMKRLDTPLMVTGFTPRAMNLLTDKLKPFSLVPYTAGTATSNNADGGVLEPGSSVAVEMVRGDVSLSALGTVTYVRDNNVLAFGHQFFRKGAVNFFMSQAQVLTTIGSTANSFKVGSPGKAVGMINQDRGAGVSGILGKYPDIIPMRVTVRDNSTGATGDIAVQIVDDEQLAPVFTTMTAYNAIDKVLDRAGAGTARINFEISALNIPSENIKRENMFFSDKNIGELAVAELYEVLAFLAGNPYNSVNVMDVKVDVTVDNYRKTATILEAQIPKDTAHPGDTLKVNVKLKPYRGDVAVIPISFKIPDNQPLGSMMLEVRGGGFVPMLKNLITGEAMPLTGRRMTKNIGMDKALEEFAARDRNNDIVVEPLDLSILGLELEQEGKGKKNKASKHKNPEQNMMKNEMPNSSANKQGAVPVKSCHSTEYIVEGDTQLIVEVLPHIR